MFDQKNQLKQEAQCKKCSKTAVENEKMWQLFGKMSVQGNINHMWLLQCLGFAATNITAKQGLYCKILPFNICPNCKMYHDNCKMYLFKLPNISVAFAVPWICSYRHCCQTTICSVHAGNSWIMVIFLKSMVNPGNIIALRGCPVCVIFGFFW